MNLSRKIILAVCALALAIMAQTGIDGERFLGDYNFAYDSPNGYKVFNTTDYTKDRTVGKGTTVCITGSVYNPTKIEFIAILDDNINSWHIEYFCNAVGFPIHTLNRDINATPDSLVGGIWPLFTRIHHFNPLCSQL
jgi:hypothetical protein